MAGTVLFSKFLALVYANPVAVKGLNTGTYANEAVFVFDLLNYTEKDLTIQEGDRKLIGIMHKDSNKYSSTGGWGFEGFSGDSKTKRLVNDGGQSCFACHTLEKGREHIQRTVEIIQKISGKSPVGWYTGWCSKNTRDLLIQQGGFRYDSDAYNDDLPYWFSQQTSHLIIPYTLVNNDFRYLSGSGMDNSEAFYQSLCAAFNLLMAEGEQQPKLMSVGLHSRISGHPARADALVRFLDYVMSHERVWICRRAEIADH